MLIRLLLLLVLAFLLVRFVMRLARLAAAALREGEPTGAAAAAPTAMPLVPCRRCGVFVPRGQVAQASADGFLCRSCAAA